MSFFPFFSQNITMFLLPQSSLDHNRVYCFNEIPSADPFFKGNRTFQYSLATFDSGQLFVATYPNTSKVTIMDSNSKEINTVCVPELWQTLFQSIALTIGFSQIQYTVNESSSYTTLNVSILEGVGIRRTSVGVMFSTKDGTALGKWICSTDTLCFISNYQLVMTTIRKHSC